MKPWRRSRLPESILKRQLLAERPGASGRALNPSFGMDELCLIRSDWVSTWVDPMNWHVDPDTGKTATRAIKLDGRLLWLVRNPAYRRAYHARAVLPQEAIREADFAWSRRAEMRERKAEMLRIVRDLRKLRTRYRVTVEDAYASPLCSDGVDGFLQTLRLDRFRSFPGWLIAWLFALDRQVGFVLWEAHQRYLREQDAIDLVVGGPAGSRQQEPGE